MKKDRMGHEDLADMSEVYGHITDGWCPIC